MPMSQTKSITEVQQAIPIGRLIHDVARLRRKLLDTEMQPAGLTRSQWSVLACLSRQRGAALVQSELAKELEIGKVTLGGLIDRLEAEGFVRREADPEDRRVKRVQLTLKGKKAVNGMDVVRPIIDDIVMRGLSPVARAKISEGMLLMRSNLLQMAGTRRNTPVLAPLLAKRLQSIGRDLA